MKITLNNQEHGYRDYDITGCGTIYRACVPFNIKKSDTFNVYMNEDTKVSCIWVGDLETSLIKCDNENSCEDEDIEINELTDPSERVNKAHEQSEGMER